MYDARTAENVDQVRMISTLDATIAGSADQHSACATLIHLSWAVIECIKALFTVNQLFHYTSRNFIRLILDLT